MFKNVAQNNYTGKRERQRQTERVSERERGRERSDRLVIVYIFINIYA